MTIIRTSPTNTKSGRSKRVPSIRFWAGIVCILSTMFVWLAHDTFDLTIDILKPITFDGSFTRQTVSSHGRSRSSTRRLLVEDDAAIAIPLKRFSNQGTGSDRSRSIQERQSLPKGDFEFHARGQNPITAENHPSTSTSTPTITDHYIDVWVGNPAQTMTLAISTTSDYTAFPCKGCEDCAEKPKSGFYKHSKSPTFAWSTCADCTASAQCFDAAGVCTVSVQDAGSDGGVTSSWSAFEANDRAYIGGAGSSDPEGSDVTMSKYGFPLKFGCQTQLRGYYATTKAEGVMGMKKGPLGIVTQMHAAGILERKSFCLCFDYSDMGTTSTSSNNDSSTKGERGVSDISNNAGAVSFGGARDVFLKDPLVYAKNFDERPDGGYYVGVKRAWFREGGGVSLIPFQPTARLEELRWTKIQPQLLVEMDSGVPHSVLDRIMEQPLKDAWKYMVTSRDHSLTGEFEISNEELHRLPTLILQLEGATTDNGGNRDFDPSRIVGLAGQDDPDAPYDVRIAIPATHYLVYNDQTRKYRFGISFADGATSKNPVLGADAMRGHVLYFDLDVPRIGIAETNVCDITHSPDPPKSGPLTTVRGGIKAPLQVGSGNPAVDAIFMDDNYSRRSIDGNCKTVKCKCFVGVGYVAILVAAYVIYIFVKRDKTHVTGKQFIDAMPEGYEDGPVGMSRDAYDDDDTQVMKETELAAHNARRLSAAGQPIVPGGRSAYLHNPEMPHGVDDSGTHYQSQSERSFRDWAVEEGEEQAERRTTLNQGKYRLGSVARTRGSVADGRGSVYTRGSVAEPGNRGSVYEENDGRGSVHEPGMNRGSVFSGMFCRQSTVDRGSVYEESGGRSSVYEPGNRGSVYEQSDGRGSVYRGSVYEQNDGRGSVHRGSVYEQGDARGSVYGRQSMAESNPSAMNGNGNANDDYYSYGYEQQSESEGDYTDKSPMFQTKRGSVADRVMTMERGSVSEMMNTVMGDGNNMNGDGGPTTGPKQGRASGYHVDTEYDQYGRAAAASEQERTNVNPPRRPSDSDYDQYGRTDNTTPGNGRSNASEYQPTNGQEPFPVTDAERARGM